MSETQHNPDCPCPSLVRSATRTDFHSPSGSGAGHLNPLSPYSLVYVHDDGTVRFSYSQPKETLLLLRDLAAGIPKAYDPLCERFDRQTGDGADMSHNDELLRNALASIEHTFRKRAASARRTRRDALLPTRNAPPTAEGHDDFDLVTWMVLLEDSTA